jgi:hypothetical protein
MPNTCRVCGRPIASDSPRRKTCGHPRCRRQYDRRPVNEYRPPSAATRVRRAMATGMSEVEALEVVARIIGEPVAIVRSLWVASTDRRAA